MIKFIDVNTGNVFSGEPPYCFWFDEGQSVRINYVKPIYILTDTDFISVSIPNEGIFKLLNTEKLENEPDIVINQFNYKDLNKLFVNPDDIYTVNGIKFNDKYYIYTIYVYANSLEAGSFQQELKINNEKFLIGADFYNENETLKSNIQNFGLDLPDVIQRAIYDSNIHEEAKDNILMNRKYKELLISYKDIIANKGSYESLQKSLNWFEYGDFIKIQEYWVNNSSDRSLTRKDLSPMVTDELFNILNTYRKTTFIGLYLTLNKIKKDGDKILYDSTIFSYEDVNLLPEPTPILIDIVTKYTKEILSLKMALLGNFYATYFMPIHLDLLHSTIEHIIFSNSIKIQNFNKTERRDWFDSVETFDCNLKAENTFYLKNNRIGVNKNTVLGNEWKIGDDYDDVQLFGVDKLEDIKNIDEDDIKTFYTQLFSGISAFVPIECKLKATSKTDVIQQVQLSYNDKMIQIDKLISQDEKGYLVLKFNVLFKKILYKLNKDGHYMLDDNGNLIEVPYVIGIKLILNNGHSYIRHFKIHICDKTYQDISLYKLKKLNKEELNKVLEGENLDWNLFAFDHNPQKITDNNINFFKTWYTQYIISEHSTANVGLTRMWQGILIPDENRLNAVMKFVDDNSDTELNIFNSNGLLTNDYNLITNILKDQLYVYNPYFKTYIPLNESINTDDFLYELMVRPKYGDKGLENIRTYIYFLQKGYDNINNDFDLIKCNKYELYKFGDNWNCSFNIHSTINNPNKGYFQYAGNKPIDKFIIHINNREIVKTFQSNPLHDDQYICDCDLDNINNYKEGDKISVELYSGNLNILKEDIISFDSINKVYYQFTTPDQVYLKSVDDEFFNIFNIMYGDLYMEDVIPAGGFKNINSLKNSNVGKVLTEHNINLYEFCDEINGLIKNQPTTKYNSKVSINLYLTNNSQYNEYQIINLTKYNFLNIVLPKPGQITYKDFESYLGILESYRINITDLINQLNRQPSIEGVTKYNANILIYDQHFKIKSFDNKQFPTRQNEDIKAFVNHVQFEKIKYKNELNFIPQFHKLIPMEDNYKIQKSDILCLVPNFKYLLPIKDVKWKFKNVTTERNIIPKFKSNQYAQTIEPFISPYYPEELLPGYYNVELAYTLNDTLITKQIDSCFIIEKK